MNLFMNFKNLQQRKQVEVGLIVPLMKWSSGSEKNIENCNEINKLFNIVNKDVLTRMLVLGNKTKHIYKYPKPIKEDEKIQFFLYDICKYYSWSILELKKNWNVIDLEFLKERLSKAFAYSKKEIRQIKKVR